MMCAICCHEIDGKENEEVRGLGQGQFAHGSCKHVYDALWEKAGELAMDYFKRSVKHGAAKQEVESCIINLVSALRNDGA